LPLGTAPVGLQPVPGLPYCLGPSISIVQTVLSGLSRHLRGAAMKPWLKVFVSILLTGAIICLGLAIFDHSHSGKWLSSAGLMFDIAGIAQLDIVGFFEKILDRYGDEKKYPYGPPSHITRRLSAEHIDGAPILNWLKQTLFYKHQTGFWLIVAGFVLQFFGTWR
jgi:hypothetical protein